MLINILSVGIGGFIGAVSRYLLVKGIARIVLDAVFPYSIFLANMIGCLAIGFFAGFFVSRTDIPEEYKNFIIIGILGSFTTFSTFSLDNYKLLLDGNIIPLFFNVTLSVILGLLFVWLGIKISDLL